MAERNVTKRIFLFAGLFLIPAFFIYTFALAKQVFVELPYLGPDEIVNGDTVHYKVPPYHFTDHLGNEVSNKTLEGKVIILNTVVNSCPENCPILVRQLYELVYKRIANSKEMEDVVILSHVVGIDSLDKPDPNLIMADLPAEVNSDKWLFVTGDTNPIYDMEINRDSLGLGNPYRMFGDDVVGRRHSNSLILVVDHDGHVRSYLPGTKTVGFTEAEKQAALLCIERRSKHLEFKK